MDDKKTTDKDLGYPEGFPYDDNDIPVSLGGKLYQWVKNRYYMNQRPWTKSDVFVWKGACLHLGTYIGLMIFIFIFGWLFIKTYDKFGIGKLISFVAVVILVRISMIIRTLNDIKSELKEMNKKTPKIPGL